MGVVSRSGVCLVGVVVRRYIDFLIILMPTPLALFAAASLILFIFLMCFILVPVHFCNNFIFNNIFAQYKQTYDYGRLTEAV